MKTYMSRVGLALLALSTLILSGCVSGGFQFFTSDTLLVIPTAVERNATGSFDERFKITIYSAQTKRRVMVKEVPIRGEFLTIKGLRPGEYWVNHAKLYATDSRQGSADTLKRINHRFTIEEGGATILPWVYTTVYSRSDFSFRGRTLALKLVPLRAAQAQKILDDIADSSRWSHFHLSEETGQNPLFQ